MMLMNCSAFCNPDALTHVVLSHVTSAEACDAHIGRIGRRVTNSGCIEPGRRYRLLAWQPAEVPPHPDPRFPLAVLFTVELVP